MTTIAPIVETEIAEEETGKSFLDALKEQPTDEEFEGEHKEEEPTDLLERAVRGALYHLDEIKVYGTYGRAGECVREAGEAYDAIKALWDKYQEQQKIMDALRNPEQAEDTGYA